MKASAGGAEARAAARIEPSERQARSAKVANEASSGTQIAGRVPTPRNTPRATSAAAAAIAAADWPGRRFVQERSRMRPKVTKVNAAALGTSLLLNIA